MNPEEQTAIRILVNGQPIIESDISVAALQGAIRALTQYIGGMTIKAPRPQTPDVSEPIPVTHEDGTVQVVQ
jgi:hypothetical protein